MSSIATFASDNYATVHPEVMAALMAANAGPATPYGADAVTAQAVEAMRDELGVEAAIAFVFNGTGANLVGLQLMLRPWEHVVCARTAHIANDECGGPERLIGCKLVLLDSTDGRITPDAVRAAHVGVGFEHHTQPRVVSISQSTEYGTVYSPQQIRELADTAHELGMYLHLDGARLANAAAFLGTSLAELTWRAGVDVASFGGTKNGLMGAEAVVVFSEELKGALPYVRKQLTQLGSKGRFLSAQFLAAFTDDLWARNARQANAMAARLAAGLGEVPGVVITQPVQANAVFATMPPAMVEPLQQVASFYVWDPTRTEVRLLCSWETTSEQVDTFIAAARSLI